jgi:hypothetical protein
MGALQGIGTPAAFTGQPGPWGNPLQFGNPYAQSFAPQLPGVSTIGYPGATSFYGPYAQQQLLHSLQAAIQQVAQVVPLQLHQIQQLVQVLAQQAHQPQFTQGQPFQIPSFGAPVPWLAGTQGGQSQLFSGQPGYVM